MSFEEPDYSQYMDPTVWQDPTAVDPNLNQANLMALLQYIVPQPAIPDFEVNSKGEMQPPDIGTYNAMNTAYYHDQQNLFDPSMALMGMAFGLPTGDPTQFIDQDPGIPQPIQFTPNLDALKKDFPSLADGITKGYSLPQLKAAARALRDQGAVDDDGLNDLYDAVSAAQKEQNDTQRQVLEYQSKVASTPAKQTAMQKFAEQAGLPDPLATYTQDDITDDELGPNPGYEKHTREAQDAVRKAQVFAKKAEGLRGQASDMQDTATEFVRRLSQGLKDQRAGVLSDSEATKRSKSNLDAANWLTSIKNTMMKGLGSDPSEVDASVSPNLEMGPPPQPQAKPARRQTQRNPADDKMKEAKAAASHAKWLQRHAEDLSKDEARSKDARKAFAAARRTAAGNTPFSDAMRQRMALYSYLRNGQ